MTYPIATPVPGQKVPADLFGQAVKNAINDLDARASGLEAIVISRIARSTITADSATWNTTETQYGSVAGSLVQGYTYQVWVATSVSTSSAGTNDTGNMRIREDNVSGTQLQLQQIYLPTASTNGFFLHATAEFTAVTTGSKTFSFTGQRSSGSGNHQIRGSGTKITFMAIDLVAVS